MNIKNTVLAIVSWLIFSFPIPAYISWTYGLAFEGHWGVSVKVFLCILAALWACASVFGAGSIAVAIGEASDKRRGE